MSISTRRLLLLSSSALVALCFAGAASSQDTANSVRHASNDHPAGVGSACFTGAASCSGGAAGRPPNRTERLYSHRHGHGAPAPTHRDGKAGCARSGHDTAPHRRPLRRQPRARPPRGKPAATSPFNQPPASLSTITSSQIQASPAQSFGNLFFTLPGATSAGLAPGASRPVLRGLDDFRVRVQENGIGSMDVLRSRPGPRRADRSALDPEDRDLPWFRRRFATARRRWAAS